MGAPEAAMHCLRFALTTCLDLDDDGASFPPVRVLSQVEWDNSAQQELKLFNKVAGGTDNVTPESTCLFSNISDA